jgi:hypothetical protein
MPKKPATLSFIEIEMNHQNQKGAAMKTHMQTDIWIYRTVVVLSSIVATSVAGTVILMILDQPMPELLFALGSVAVGGLARLLVPSPQN